MFDKNGVEIRTGHIVKVTGAFFKNDNGLYYVEHSPGDPSWSGQDHCLKKVCKDGRLSKSTRNICFWPIVAFTNDRVKNAKATAWNKEHAEIEVVDFPYMSWILERFREKLEETSKAVQRYTRDFGETDTMAQQEKAIQEHYEGVIRFIEGKEF